MNVNTMSNCPISKSYLDLIVSVAPRETGQLMEKYPESSSIISVPHTY